MSIGFLVPESQPAIWRGPMVMNALRQLLEKTEWGGLDALVIDLPPGTGDVQLTLAQRARLSGALVVSTPQPVALADARKAVAMFRKMHVPILGIVENMSYFVCPHCQQTSEIFHHGGAKKLAEQENLELLAEFPLDPETREAADTGTPIPVLAPDSPMAERYGALAERVLEQLQKARLADSAQ